MEKIRKIQVGDVTYEIEDQSRPGIKTAEGGEVFNDYDNNQAKGSFSHTEGTGTVAQNQAEHAQGMYNASHTGSTEAEKTIHSVGIGTSGSDRKNAVEVMRNGDVYIKGVGGYDGTNPSASQTVSEALDAKVGKIEGKGLSTNDYTNEEKQKVADAQPKLVSGTNIKTVNGKSLLGSGDVTIDLSLYKVVAALPDQDIDINKIYLVLDSAGDDGNLYKEYAYVNGAWELLGTYKATIDVDSYLKKTEQTLTDEEKTQVQENIGVSEYMVGKKTAERGEIFNDYTQNVASAPFSHAEGSGNTVSSMCGHAEGTGTTVTGAAGHSEGFGTISQNPEEHAQGMYNASHTGSTEAEKTIHSVGIGTSDSDRKNAVEVMRNGDVYIKGVGGYDGTNPGAETTGTKSRPRSLQYHIKKRSPLPKIVVGRAIPIDARPGYIYRANSVKIRRREGLRNPHNLGYLALSQSVHSEITADDITALSKTTNKPIDITVPLLLLPDFWESHEDLGVIIVSFASQTRYIKIGERTASTGGTTQVTSINVTDVTDEYNTVITPTASPNLILQNDTVVPTVAPVQLRCGNQRSLDVSSFASGGSDKRGRRMYYTRSHYRGGNRTKRYDIDSQGWIQVSHPKKQVTSRKRYYRASGYFNKNYGFNLSNKEDNRKGHGRMCHIELQKKIRKRYWATAFYADVNLRKVHVEV